MKQLIRLMLLLPMVLGIVVLTSCGDDDEPAPADPTITLNSNASDANRGQQVSITGTITAPGGFAELTSSVQGVSVSGITTGETGEQNFTAMYTVPSEATIGFQIAINLQVVDDLEQTSSSVTYTISVVSEGAPTISVTGNTTANLKRRATGSVELNISAPDGLNDLIVTDGDDNAVASIASSEIADPSSYTFEFTVPDNAMVDGTYVLNFNASDNAGQTTMTAGVFTTTVLAFDVPTIAFKNLENEGDTAYSAASSPTITFVVSKDDLVSFNELSVAKEVNEGTPEVSVVDISSETGPEIVYTFSVPEEFPDEVSYTFFLSDEFEASTEQITVDADILTTSGATFLIDDFDVNGNAVQRVRGEITEDVTLMAANDYYLVGGVRVDDDATLTIEAGTTVYAQSGEEVELRIEGIINAQGTSSNPIVMTSGAALEGGTQEGADWIGLRINGEASRSSGTIQYVRVEYGGFDNASIRMNEVDALTTIDYVQSWRSGGIGVEMRGGTVNLSHVFVSEAQDISISVRGDDTSYSGNLQYVIIQSSTIAEKGDRDLEARRNDPSITVSNLTMIGSGADVGDLNAIRLDDNTNYQIYNSLIAEYSGDGIRVDYEVPDYDVDGNALDFSYIFQIGGSPTRDNQDPDSMPLPFETDAGTYSNTIDADNTPPAAAGIGVADFVPDATIPSMFDPTALGDFFQAGSYVGAIGDTDWTLGWTLNADGSAR